MRKILPFLMAFLFAGSMFAQDAEQIASGTFNGKNETYTTGWSTTGSGKTRTDCIVIYSGENVTSPTIDLSEYASITINIKARRFGKLSGSKATIAVSFGDTEIGSVDATSTSATTALAAIEYENTSLKTGTFVFICTNATASDATDTGGAGINSIEITGVKKSSSGIDNPTISPAVSDFDGSIEVTLACATSGASIYYTTDGSEPTVSSSKYTGPFTIYETATIKAIASYQGGLSNIVSRTYTKIEKLTCAEFAQLSSGTSAYLNDVVVTCTDGAKNTWVRDGSGSLLIYFPSGNANNDTYKFYVGETISGLKGELTMYNIAIPELKTSQPRSELTVSSGVAPEAEVFSSLPTSADINKFVEIQGASIVGSFEDGTTSNLTLSLGDESMVLRSQFKNAYTFESGKTYNVKAIVSYYSDAVQLYFVDAEEVQQSGTTYTTVYFANIPGWTTPYAYIWLTGSTPYATWPGQIMDKTTLTANGYDFYSYTFPDGYENIIFNDGLDNEKTGDLVREAGKPYYYDGTWYAKIDDIPEPAAVNLGPKTIAEFLALKNLKDTCILTGIVSNIQNTTYGNFDLVEIDDPNNTKVYIYGLLTADGVSKQFANLDVEENDTLTIKAIYTEYNNTPEVKDAYFVSRSKYVDPSQVTTTTVYFVDTKGWAEVNAYVWYWDGGSNSKEYTGWPGGAMTKTSQTVYGYDIYSYTFPKEYNYLIFSNNAGAQTNDLTWEAGKPYCYNEVWYAKIDDIPDPTATHTVIVNFAPPAGAPAAGVDIIGTFDNWAGTEMTKMNSAYYGGDYYTATLSGITVNDEFKFREHGDTDWKNEPLYNDQKMGNIKFSDVWTDISQYQQNADRSVEIDWRGDEYSWAVPAQPTTPTISIIGEWDSNVSHDFEVSSDGTTATYDVQLSAGTYEFSLFNDGNYVGIANGNDLYGLHRGWRGVGGITNGNGMNFKLTADIDGTYLFTWTYANDSINISFPPKSVADKYYMRNNWKGGSEWTWLEMTKDGDQFKLEKVVFGGTGVDYNDQEADKGAMWVSLANILGDQIGALDTVTFVLDPVAETVTATLIGKYVEPVTPPTHPTISIIGEWDSKVQYDFYVSDDDAATFEVKQLSAGIYWFTLYKDNVAVGVNNNGNSYGLNRGWRGVGGINIVDGDNFLLEADVDGTYLFSWTFDNDSIHITFPAKPVADQYYMCNNWKGEDWAWLEMAKDGDKFKLENVVFGGNGVNYNDQDNDKGAMWVPLANILGDPIGALDTVTFILDPVAETVTAQLIGKYEEPVTPPTPQDGLYFLAGWIEGVGDITYEDQYDFEKGQITVAFENDAYFYVQKVVGTEVTDYMAAKYDQDATSAILQVIAAGSYGEKLRVPSDNGQATLFVQENADGTLTLWYEAKTEPGDPNVKFYVAGSMTDWADNKIAVFDDSYEFGQLDLDIQKFKIITPDGNWLGFDELTNKEGLVADLDNNICFVPNPLVQTPITVTYTANEFTVTGGFIAIPAIPDGYYLGSDDLGGLVDLVSKGGSLSDYKFVLNTEAQGEEYSLTRTLELGDKVSVIKVEGNALRAMYPERGGAITINENYVGEKTIYFRPEANEDWKEFEKNGFFWIEKNTTPAEETVRLYVVNKPNWKQLYAYVWKIVNSSSIEWAKWPGELLKLLVPNNAPARVQAVAGAGEDIYYFDCPKSYTNIIFNDGDANQTADLTWEEDKPFFVLDALAGTDGKFNGEWSKDAPAVVEYTFAYSVEGLGEVTSTKENGSYDAGTSITLTAAPATDWNFAGWIVNDGTADLTNPLTITLGENTTVVAKFTTTQKFKVTIKADEGGKVTPEDYNEKEVVGGAKIDIKAEADEDWKFIQWKEDGSTDAERSIVITQDTVLTAVFEEITYYKLTVTIEPEDAGEIFFDGKKVNKNTKSYQEGTTVKLTAEAAEGYEFDYWDENGTESTAAELSVVMNKKHNITANFKKKTQGLDELKASGRAVKIYHNGTLYILRGEKVYTADGLEVK